jgi:hypothetical protein
VHRGAVGSGRAGRQRQHRAVTTPPATSHPSPNLSESPRPKTVGTSIHWYSLTDNRHVCSRMLTYARVCWRMLTWWSSEEGMMGECPPKASGCIWRFKRASLTCQQRPGIRERRLDMASLPLTLLLPLMPPSHSNLV